MCHSTPIESSHIEAETATAVKVDAVTELHGSPPVTPFRRRDCFGFVYFSTTKKELQFFFFLLAFCMFMSS